MEERLMIQEAGTFPQEFLKDLYREGGGKTLQVEEKAMQSQRKERIGGSLEEK